jgi:hypothetical protein
MPDFILVGIPELDAALSEFSRQMDKKIINEALLEAAFVVERHAATLAPVKTEKTVEALHVAKISRKNKNSYGYNVMVPAGTSNTYYSAWVDIGHHQGARTSAEKRKQILRKALGIEYGKSDSDREWIEGSHWLERAMEDKQEEAKAKAIEIIQSEIERVQKNMARKAARAARNDT